MSMDHPSYAATQMRLRWLGVPLWHEQGYKGQGMKIGIVDANTNVSLARYPEKIHCYKTAGNSDWTKNFGFHGLASIDIIQQIVPEAEIYFGHWTQPLGDIVQWFMQNDVDVVSVSLAYYYNAIADTISNRAVDSGMLLFTSAGNDGDMPEDVKGYPAKTASWIAVGAGLVSGFGELPYRAGYSSTGKELEIMGMTHLYVQMPPPMNSMVYNGTSCASPALAGCFALVEQKMGALSQTQVRQMFTEHTVDLDIPSWDSRTGWGMFKMPHPVTGDKIKEIVLTIDSNLVSVDSQQMQIDQPAVINPTSDRTMVPLSFIAKTLGHKVDWKPDTRQVVIDNRIVLNIDSDIVEVSGRRFQIDQAPYIDPNTWRTLVPLSFISRELGYDVYWHAPTRQIVIS